MTKAHQTCLLITIISILAPMVHANELRMKFLKPSVAFTPPRPTPNVLKIGTAITLDANAKYAGLGGALKNAYVMYFDWLQNHKGGITIKNKTYMVELILIDDSSSKVNVGTITDHLIANEGVNFFLAPYSSGLTGVASPKAHAAGALLMAAGSSSSSVFAGRPTVFGTLTPSSQYLVGAFTTLGAADSGSKKKIAMVQEDVKWPLGVCAKVPNLAVSNNMELAPNGTFTIVANAGEDQVKNVVTSLIGLAPDIVITCTYRIACHALLRQMRKQQFYTKAIVATICVTEGDFIDVLGTAGQYVLGVTPWMAALPLTSQVASGWTAGSFAGTYKALYGTVPPYQAASAFASVSVLVKAMEDAESTDPLLVAAQLKKANHATMFGTVAFDANGQCKNEVKVIQFQSKSTAVLVSPKNEANGVVVYPKPNWAAMECLNLDSSAKSRMGNVNGACVECPLGKRSDVVTSGNSTTRLCVSCEAGKYGGDASGYQICISCTPGFFSNTTGQDSCIACPPGSFQSQTGSKSCGPCRAGFVTPEKGSSECVPCAAGMFGNETGKPACRMCPIGEYTTSVGRKTCMKCGKGLVTEYPGMTSKEKCMCPTATYRNLAGTCEGCPGGMTCEFGSAQAKFSTYASTQSAGPFERAPELNKGFFSTSEDPLSVYLCEPTYICAAGQPGENCAGDRTKFMCVDCPTDYVNNGDLEDDEAASGCTKCATTMLFYIIVFPIIGLLALFAVLLDAKHSPLEDNPVLVELKMVSGQVIMFLQIIGCILAANLSFGNPMTGALSSLAEPIDLDQFFSNTPCISSGFKDSSALFAIQVLMPAVFVLLLVVAFSITNAIRPGLIKGDGLLNAVGEILIEFYVSITIAVLAPMNCYEHPNGKQSMKGNAEIVCGEDTHNVMMALSILALLMYPVACFAVTLFATWQHPKRLAKNDIGMLVRCHFIFNRWRPQCYWFAVPAVGRNFFVALWPMVIPEKENDVAVMLMIGTLLTALMLLCLIKPRRTPAMGALDVQISAIQLMILGIGAMSVYSGDLQSDFMSWVLLFLTVSIFLTSFILVVLKGMQWLSKNRSPGSWCFDIFLDHHAAGGGSTVRVLQVFLNNVVRPGKVFYDLDWYMANDKILGVITDAVKLSKNCLIVLGNETWCRDWCVAAIASGVQAKVPMQTITTGGNCLRSFEMDFSLKMVDTLARQAPREKLRPLGLSDLQIPQALQAVLKIKPLLFSMQDQQKMETCVTTLLNLCVGVGLRQGMDKFPAITSKFFSKVSTTQVNQAATVGAQGGTWYDKQQEYVLISADHQDAEAVAVSRLVYSLLKDLINGTSLTGSCLPGSSHPAWQNLMFIEDIDLEASELKDLVTSGKVPAVLVILTSKSFQSVPQLLRLGLVHKYAHQTRFKPVPLAIGDTFRLPGLDVLIDIESGAVLPADMSEEAAAMQYASEIVSFSQARQSLSDTMNYRMPMLNVPVQGEAALRKALTETLFRIIDARDDLEYGTSQSIPVPFNVVESDSVKADPGMLLDRQKSIEKKRTQSLDNKEETV